VATRGGRPRRARPPERGRGTATSSPLRGRDIEGDYDLTSIKNMRRVSRRIDGNGRHMNDVYQTEINPDDEPGERLQEGLRASEADEVEDDEVDDDDVE